MLRAIRLIGIPLVTAICFQNYVARDSQADLITVNNPSFEADFAPDGSFPVLIPQGWTTFDPNGLLASGGNAVGVINPTGTTFFPGGVPDGRNAALVYISENLEQGPVGLTQVLTDTLQANMNYRLQVDVGNIASGTGLPPYDQFGFFDLDGFPGYQVQVLAGGVVVAEDNNSLFGSIPEGEFRTSEISFSVGDDHDLLGQSLEIRLLNLNQIDTVADPGIEVDFDNVRFEASAVPEPSTYFALVLITAGIGAFTGYRKWSGSRGTAADSALFA